MGRIVRGRFRHVQPRYWEWLSLIIALLTLGAILIGLRAGPFVLTLADIVVAGGMALSPHFTEADLSRPYGQEHNGGNWYATLGSIALVAFTAVWLTDLWNTADLATCVLVTFSGLQLRKFIGSVK